LWLQKIFSDGVLTAYPNDNSRLDIVVNNEQRWYLKTNNAAERQAWLIALGTSKANGADAVSLKKQGVAFVCSV